MRGVCFFTLSLKMFPHQMSEFNQEINDLINETYCENLLCEGYTEITASGTQTPLIVQNFDNYGIELEVQDVMEINDDTIYLQTQPEPEIIIISSDDESEKAPYIEKDDILMISDDNVDEIVQNYMTPTICNQTQDYNSDEEIPAITIKTKTNEDKFVYDQELLAKNNRVLPLLIIEIIKSEMISRHPPLYKIHGIQYKFTKIVGTIISISRHSECRHTIRIQDASSSSIKCIVENKLGIERSRDAGNNLLALCERREEAKKRKLLEPNTVDFDEEIIEENFDNYLEKQARKIVHKFNKRLEMFPRVQKLNLGDQVTVVGKVVDLNERIIFPWFVRFTKDSESLIKHLNAEMFPQT